MRRRLPVRARDKEVTNLILGSVPGELDKTSPWTAFLIRVAVPPAGLMSLGSLVPVSSARMDGTAYTIMVRASDPRASSGGDRLATQTGWKPIPLSHGRLIAY